MVGSYPERRIWTRPTTIRRLRSLPVDGRVLVREGDIVEPGTVVVRGQSLGPPLLVPVGKLLGLDEPNIERCIVKRSGDSVDRGEIIAETRGMLGLGARSCRAPSSGTIEMGPRGSGEILILPFAQSVETRAHLPGVIVSVLPLHGVVIELAAVGFQAATGSPGEVGGRLRLLSDPREMILPMRLVDRWAGTVIAGGTIDLEGLRRAADIGIQGVIVGSLNATAFEAFRAEQPQLPVIVTEGFGRAGMSERVYEILRQYEGCEARLSGGGGEKTAEVLIPILDPAAPRSHPIALDIGALARIVSGDYIFAVGLIVAVGANPCEFGGGLVDSYIDLRLDCGDQIRAPLTNIELMTS